MAITIDSQEIISLAREVCNLDVNRHPTIDQRKCALLLYRFKERAANTPRGAAIFSDTKAAEILNGEQYRQAGKNERLGMVKDVKKYGLRLANMSAETRGRNAIAVVCFTPQAKQLFRDVHAGRAVLTTHELLTEATRAMSVGRNRSYVAFGAFSNVNGEFVLAWTQRNFNNAQGKILANRRREMGWNDAGIIAPATMRALQQMRGEIPVGELPMLNDAAD